MILLKRKYNWNVLAKGIVADEEIFKTILSNRHIEDYETYFSQGKETLHDPYLLKDMDKAVKRIKKAVRDNELIMIYGDYDCDGISSIALLYRAIKLMNANVVYDLPNRFVDGYGLNNRAVEQIIKANVKLVITVDNGITCHEQVDLLNQAGIDTIITDHHEIGQTLPEAYAIIHAKLSENYPFKEIAGVMTAYKLACALHNSTMDDLMDLAMIGTIADLMPLTDENQAIVNLGLKHLKYTKHVGLKKLVEYTDIDIINVTAIAFKIAPKINSSGRLGKALDAVKLLITDNHREANELIIKIDRNHKQRKKLTEVAFNACEKLINPEDNVIVVASKDLHEGVIGICAQKIVEKYQRSTLVITIDNEGYGKGSMRSFGDDNILEMLHKNKQFLIKYGGHSQAAGLQIKAENISALAESLNEMTAKGQIPTIDIDMEVDLCNVKIKTVREIQDKSFYTASYLVRNLRIVDKRILARKHTKLIVECHGTLYDALHFNNLEYYYALEKDDLISAVVGLNVNEYRSRVNLQLMIKDIACDDFQVLDFHKVLDYREIKPYVNSSAILLSDKLIFEKSWEEILAKNVDSLTFAIQPKAYRNSYHKIANRTELGKIFKLLRNYREFNLDSLVKRTDYTFVTLDYAIRIFEELNLIEKTKNGKKINSAVTKVELTDSKIFKGLLAKKDVINWLYNSDISAIKNDLQTKLEEIKNEV